MTWNQPAVASLLAAILLVTTSGCGLLCPTPCGPGAGGVVPGVGSLAGPDQPIQDIYGPQPFRTGVDMFLPHYHGIPYCGDGCADGCGSVYWHEWFSDPPSPCDPCGSACGGPKWLYGQCCLGDGHCCRHLAQILYGTFSTMADWDFGLRILTPHHSPYGPATGHGCLHCGFAVPAGDVYCDQCLAGGPLVDPAVFDGAGLEGPIAPGEIDSGELVVDEGLPTDIDSTLAIPGITSDPAEPPTVLPARHEAVLNYPMGDPPRTRPAHRITTQHLGPLRSPPVRW